jgi:hypothetical protein
MRKEPLRLITKVFQGKDTSVRAEIHNPIQ